MPTVPLSDAERFGVMHVLAVMQGVDMDAALHIRAIRKQFRLDEMAPEQIMYKLRNRQDTTPYGVESAEVAWLRLKIKELFDTKRILAEFADLVLEVYEKLDRAASAG